MKTRTIWKSLHKELEKDDILVLTGARQVGKTTTIEWLLSQISSPNKYYFDLENIRNRDLFSVKDYDSLIGEFQNLGLDTSKKLFIALDEIQLLPQIPSVIKYLYDHYHIKFLITGSSSYYLKNLFSESMAGRKTIYEMYPLSFGEFLDFKEEPYILSDFQHDLPFSEFAYQKLKHLYDEYIEYGGLPKIVLTIDVTEKKRKLEMIFSSYISIDVQSLSEFKSLGDFSKLIQLLASRVGNKVNISQFAKILGISRQTVDSYLTFMEQTYLIRLIKPLSQSVDVQIRKSPKLYFVDTGIANINYDLSIGAKYENAVCHQLFLHANQTAFGRDLVYYSNQDSEVDFILNKTQALEVKETPIDTDHTKLVRVASKLGLTQYRLIGRNKPVVFDNFIWGGSIK